MHPKKLEQDPGVSLSMLSRRKHPHYAQPTDKCGSFIHMMISQDDKRVLSQPDGSYAVTRGPPDELEYPRKAGTCKR